MDGLELLIQTVWCTARDRYARRKHDQRQGLLFDMPGQQYLPGIGPGRWVTIGGDKGPDGRRHGGRPVFIGADGEMKTGKFAGMTPEEAFKGHKEKSRNRESEDEKQTGSKVGKQAPLFDSMDDADEGRPDESESPEDQIKEIEQAAEALEEAAPEAGSNGLEYESALQEAIKDAQEVVANADWATAAGERDAMQRVIDIATPPRARSAPLGS